MKIASRMESVTVWKLAPLIVALLTLASCVSGQSTWLTDYDSAKETAALEGKNIFLLISNDGESALSVELRQNVFDAPALLRGLARTFVALNLDFSEERYNAAEEAGKGSDEEKQIIRDVGLANKYSVETTPAVYLLTKEGYVIDTVEIDDEVTTARELVARVNVKKGRIAEYAGLLSAARETEGLEKVRAIDALYEGTQGEYRDILDDIFRVVPDLDPTNETGVVGKYLLQIAFIDAVRDFNDNNFTAGFSKFRTVAGHPLLSPEEKQNAWFYLGIFTYQITNNVNDTVAHFKQAIAADPQSEQALSIEQIILQLTPPSSQSKSAPRKR